MAGSQIDRARPSGHLGPNAIIQTLRAVGELHGPDLREFVFARAAIPEARPKSLVPEDWFLGLLGAVRAALPERECAAVLQRSGRYTAEYVRAHRIPRLFCSLLRVLPARVSIPLLLFAFQRHAWTFVGTGRFRFEGPYPGVIIVERCPSCRSPGRGPGGEYYAAAFEGLLQLARPGLRVREVACRRHGSPACRFAISLS